MDKPTMLYASPFPPKKSGISDYSVQLVKALSKKYNITLYTDNYIIDEDLIKDIPVLRHGYDDIDFDSFDYKIYNIGNQPSFHWYIYEAAIKHPGLIILHDFVLYYLFVGYYQRRSELYSSLYSKIGIDSFLEVKKAVKRNGTNLLEQNQLAQILTLNKELISSGNKIMVHSDYSRNKILETGLIKENEVRKINHLSLMNDDEEYMDKKELFSKYEIPEDAVVVASFGYIAETKLNREVCEAVKNLRDVLKDKGENKKICYVMVGDGEYVDDELEEGFIIKTGYTGLKEFNSFIKHSDIIINLRNPSMGETSGAMIRILQMGKPCIINEGGWFSELPNDCVVKIGLNSIEDNLEKAIYSLLDDADRRIKIENRTKDYINREYNPDVITGQIADFLTSSI